MSPYSVQKRGSRYAIVNRATRRVAGYSATKQRAQRSANARNAGAHGWRGTRKR